MARETIAKTDVKYDNANIYFIRKGDIWSAPRKKPGQPKGAKGKQVKAAATGVELDYSKYMYFVGRDNEGNLKVERTDRQVGGSKRAKKGGAKKAGAKKGAAKKSSAKKASGGKKGKKGKKR